MNTENAMAELNEGDRLLESGNLEEAIAAYRHAIELNPDLSWSYHNLGEALGKLGQFEDAIAAFRRAIELNPDFSWSYHHLGDALDRQQQWEEAVVAFRRAIELNPEHFGSYVGLGQSLMKLGQLDETIVAYRRASELEPEAEWIQHRLGEVLQQRTQLDLEDAIASYHRAVELNPDDVQAYRKLLQIQPDNFEVWLQLGKALVKQEQWEEAIAAYRHITELNPDDVPAHYRLGELLIKQGDLEGAIDTFRQALELSPNSDESYYNLGEALASQGNITEASLCYHKAFKLNPNNMQANQKRPRIYDCFAFFNELDVLRIRIEELKDVVDKFILVEATKTHSGNPKPLYYQEFSHEFAEYQDKIIHYVVDDMPEVINGDRWPLEMHQRDCIIRPLRLIPCDDADIILISDIDEIPRKEKIEDAINLLLDNDFVIFTQALYYNNIDDFQSQWWCGTVACKYKDFKVRTACQVRRSDEGFWSPNWKAADIRKEGFQHPYIENGGWHFTSFGGGTKTSRYKLQSYAHAEGDNSKETGIPLINFDVARPTNDEDSLGKYYYDIRDVEGKDIPDYLKRNIRQYRHFLKPKLTQMAIAHADLHLELASGIYKENLEIAVNLWCCAMQLNPQIGKKQSFLSELQPVDYFQISPQQLCNRSGKLIQNEKGYQLVSYPEPGQLPLVSFGPYISVPDGIYRVKIDVEMDTIEAKETNNHQIFGFKFDLVSGPGNPVLWDEKVDICDAQTEFYLELRNAQQLEVRFFSTGQKFAINSIELALLYRLEPNQSIYTAQDSGNKRDMNNQSYFERTMQNHFDDLLDEQNHRSGEEISKPFEDCLESEKTLSEQGAFESAIASYRRAIELNPDDVQAYRNLLEIQPDNFEVWLQLGKILVKLGQWEDAIGCFRKSCELQPNSFSSHYKLGIALSQFTEIKINSLKSDPETVEILLRNLQSKNPSASLSELNDIAFCRATDHLKDEDFFREVYRAYLRREVESGTAEEWSQKMRQGDFTRLIFVNGIRQSTEFKMKISHLSVREREEYITRHWRSIEISYENIAEEIAYYRQAIELDHNSIECQYYLSKALRKNAQLSESEALLKKAVHLGIVFAQENRIEEALNVYKKGLEIIPENRTYLLDLALILVKLGHIESLLKCCKHTLKLSSDVIRASHELGIFLAEQGLLNEALICFNNDITQVPSCTKWEMYEKIWDKLNDINPSICSKYNYPTDVNQEEVAECFTDTSRYKMMTLENISRPDKKYLEKLGISLAYVELMGHEKFVLEKIYIKSFGDASRELSDERLNLTHLSYQQSLVETGYVYTICPWSGKVLRSNQSFVINHHENLVKQRGHDLQGFCYRFVSKKVFYLIVGCASGERLFVYVPKCELIMNFRSHLVGFAEPVSSVNKLKSYMVGSWSKVINYILTPDKQVVDVIGLGFNMGHYLWQDLVGIDVLLENGVLDKLDKILTGPGDYFSSRDIFPEIPANKFIEVEDVSDVFQKVIENNYVALRVNGIFIKEKLTDKVRQIAFKKCSHEFLEEVETARKHWPVLGVQVRAKGRVWLSQVEGIANIIKSLYSDFPNLAIVFDGWSLTGKEDCFSASYSIIEDEKSVMREILSLIPDNIPVYNAIGATIFETVAWWVEAIDTHISPNGSGLTAPSWIANKPGVVHGPLATYYTRSLYAQSVYIENLLPQVFIPEQHIIDKGDGSYDCDWRVIYEEVIKILPELPELREREIYSQLPLCDLNPEPYEANHLLGEIMQPIIYDCFPFFNEIDLLKIRIEELKDVVHKFVLLESTKTHSGKPKPLYYKDFINEFAEYQDQIIHYVVEDMPELPPDGNRWVLEAYQRDCIPRVLEFLGAQDEDVVLVSDVDEIPKKDKLNEAIGLLNNQDFVRFQLDFYRHNLGYFVNSTWNSSYAIKYKCLKQGESCTQIRNQRVPSGVAFIPQAGWHFSSFGDLATLRYKMQSFAHAELDNTKDLGFNKDFHISRLTDDEAHEYIYDFSEIEGKHLPEYLNRNIQSYKHFLKPKNTNTIKERLEQSQLQIQQLDTDIQKLQQLQQQRQQICAEIESWEYQRHVMQKGYHFTSDWFSGNIPNWKNYLSRFVNVPEINALEIGSWEGRSACWLIDNVLTHESARLTCIDTWQGSTEHTNFDKFLLLFLQERFDVNISLTGHPEKVVKKVGFSYDVMRLLPMRSYDFIYVDGSHEAEPVLEDAILAWGLVKVGGLIVFDDYGGGAEVKMGLDPFLSVFARKINILHVGYQVFIEKIAE